MAKKMETTILGLGIEYGVYGDGVIYVLKAIFYLLKGDYKV